MHSCHRYFKDDPQPISPDLLPYWPAKSEGEAKAHKSNASPEAPAPGGQVAEDDGGYSMATAAPGRTYEGPSGFKLRF